MPSLSITPARKFSITTSAFAASFLTIAIASGFVQVQRQAALVAVDRQPARRHPAVGPFAGQRRAAHVLTLAPFHLDDVGAQQCELVAGIGAGQHLREVENPDAFEWSGQFSFLLRT